MEFAIVAVLLFAVLFAIIDFGMLFSQQNSLSNAARQGARHGVVSSSDTCRDIAAEVQKAAAGGTLGIAAPPNSPVNVTFGLYPDTGTNPCPSSGSTPCTGSFSGGQQQALVVTATYASKPLVPLLYVATPTFTLSAKATYQCEYS